MKKKIYRGKGTGKEEELKGGRERKKWKVSGKKGGCPRATRGG